MQYDKYNEKIGDMFVRSHRGSREETSAVEAMKTVKISCGSWEQITQWKP